MPYYEGTANRVKERNQKGQKEPVCYYCNKKGHKKAGCWDLHPGKRPQKDQEDQRLENLAMGMRRRHMISSVVILLPDDFMITV